MNKRFTEKTAAAVCKRLLKDAVKCRADLAYGWTDDKGRQCFSDGYRGYRFNNALPGLPWKEEHAAASALAQVFAPLDAGGLVEMPTPDADAVKSFVEAHKRGGEFIGVPYDLGDLLPMVNPLFVLDALRLFPGAVWYVLPDLPKRITSPVFLVHPPSSSRYTTGQSWSASRPRSSPPPSRPKMSPPRCPPRTSPRRAGPRI